MDQDKRYHSHEHQYQTKNLLSLDENESIYEFVDEILILYNNSLESICLQFIVTSDRVEGNGRVILHINPHQSTKVPSFQLENYLHSSY